MPSHEDCGPTWLVCHVADLHRPCWRGVCSLNVQTRLFDSASAPLEKRCPRCRLFKSILEFPRRSLVSAKPTAYCRPCQRAYSKSHYQQHKPKHNSRRRRHESKNRSICRDRLARYLSVRSCVDCAESDPVVLEFDHVRGQKKDEICMLVCRNASWTRIVEEIGKSEIRCANSETNPKSKTDRMIETRPEPRNPGPGPVWDLVLW